MAEEVVINLLCDHCLADDGRRVGAQRFGPFTFNRQTMVVDACEDTAAKVIEPFIEFMQQYGRKEGANATTKKAAPKVVAPQTIQRERVGRPSRHQGDPSKMVTCLCGRWTGFSRSGLQRHTVKDHGVMPEGIFGKRCPVCGAEFATGRAMSNHAGRLHASGDWDDLSRLFELMRAEDPHGVVAARIAEIPQAS